MKLGNYTIISASVLPDQFARLLYEFHDFQFESLDLPVLLPLPADQSDFDVHGVLGDVQVLKTVNRGIQ